MKKTRLKIISITMAAVFLFSSTAWALPQGATVVNGNSTITKPDAQTMHITQTSDKSIINWQGYSIGTSEKVQYFQPGRSSISLNRVTGQDPSGIYGHLSANGQVWVINPNGLLIGNNAKINTGSFLGSTLNIGDDDFLKSNYKFKQQGALTSIKNFGSIISQNGGYVALISPEVVNEGSITANLGKAYLASGSEFTLNFAGNDLIGFTIDKEAAEAALGITNKGLITANGGEVILSAKVASHMMKTVVNNEGVIEAKTIGEKNGKIYLLGGMETNAVEVSGTLDASAPGGGNGGFIETSAAKVKVADSAVITTYAPYGKTGTWLIDPADFTIAASGGNMTGSALSTMLNNSSLSISLGGGGTGGNGDINVNDAVSWSANTTLNLEAYRNVNVNANITATGNTAGLFLTPGSSGAYNLNNGAVITLSGLHPSLFIAGHVYTVINSLGAAGSISGTDLQGINGNLGDYYALGSNIDAYATSTWNSGAGFTPLGNSSSAFTGVFDGLGHTITGLTINRSTTNYQGLFGATGNGSVIRNVGLVGGSVTGSQYVGGLVGYNYGSIANSYSTGNVTGGTKYIGGLTGLNGISCSISNSYNTGAVSSASGSDSVGGLTGTNYGLISNSYNTGAVSGTSYVGGLEGFASGSVANSYNTGTITGTSCVGGVAGWLNVGAISNSYSTGNVTGNSKVGGLAGWLNGGTISNSYSTGSVSGSSDVGGLVGISSGTVTNSFWDKDTSGQNTSSGGTGLNTSQVMAQANYTGFDFTNTWWMSEGNTRPFLRMEYSTNITNAHQLQLMALNLGASYTLAKNIDMSELTLASKSGMWDITKGFVPIGDNLTKFTGVFDGLGHTISNLYINRPGTYYVGLFGYTASGSIVRNVGLVDGSVIGQEEVGGLVGYNAGTITNSYNTGAVTGTYYVGGLVGRNAGTISESYYSTGEVTGSNAVGGLVGLNDYGPISNSYSSGAVTGSGAGIGGLAGRNFGPISNSYSKGIVTGKPGATDVGGLVGFTLYGGTTTNCFWDKQTSGQINSYGGSEIGLLTTEMKTLSQFTPKGWDMDDAGGTGTVWRIYDGKTYPLLRSFLTALTVTANDDTKTYDGNAYGAGYANGRGNGVSYDPSAAGKVFGTSTYGGTAQSNKDAGVYTITTAGLYSNQQGYDISYAPGTLTIDKKALSITGSTVSNKPYDGNTDATVTAGTLSGMVTGETLGVSGSGAFKTKDAETNKDVTAHYSLFNGTNGGLATNYSLANQTLKADITQKALSIAGSTVSNKPYDGNTDATVTAGTLSGMIGTETLGVSGSGAFKTKDAETNKDVTAHYSLSNGANGGLATNYSLADQTLKADITQKALSIAGSTAANKIYDGDTTATVTAGTLSGMIGTEALGVSGSGAFKTKDAETNKDVTAHYSLSNGANGGLATNYSLADQTLKADITRKALSISGSSVTTKTYDGNTDATVTAGTLSNLVGLETLSVSGKGTFADKNAGTGKNVTASYTLSDGTNGGLATNYILDNQNLTGAINRRDLGISGSSASNKVYDGNTIATVTAGTLSNLVGTETLGVSGSGTFADKNVGTGKNVTATYTLSNGTNGGLATNYSLAGENLTANITPKALTVTANNDSKIFNGVAYSGGKGVTYNGLVNGEDGSVLGGTLTYSGTSQGAINIGTYTITPGGLTSGNYNISFADGSLAITALPWIFDLYHTLEHHSDAVTNVGNFYTGPFAKAPNFEIDPSVFDDNQ